MQALLERYDSVEIRYHVEMSQDDFEGPLIDPSISSRERYNCVGGFTSDEYDIIRMRWGCKLGATWIDKCGTTFQPTIYGTGLPPRPRYQPFMVSHPFRECPLTIDEIPLDIRPLIQRKTPPLSRAEVMKAWRIRIAEYHEKIRIARAEADAIDLAQKRRDERFDSERRSPLGYVFTGNFNDESDRDAIRMGGMESFLDNRSKNEAKSHNLETITAARMKDNSNVEVSQGNEEGRMNAFIESLGIHNFDEEEQKSRRCGFLWFLGNKKERKQRKEDKKRREREHQEKRLSQAVQRLR